MIATLTGDNSYLLNSTLVSIIKGFTDEYGELMLERLNSEESSYDKIREALQSLPFLGGKKLVVLQSPSSVSGFVEAAEELLTNIPHTTDLVIVEPNLDKRSTYHKLVRKMTDFREFAELDPARLAQWLVDQAKTSSGNLSRADANYLIGRIGANQQRLASELAKLVLYDPKVNRQTIDLLTEASPQSTIFQLLDAALSGNLRLAIAIYREQRQLKVEPQQIIAMLAWQFHIVAILKSRGNRPVEAIAAEANLRPFVARKSALIAQRLNPETLKRIISELLEIDVRLKRETVNANEVMEMFLIKLTAQPTD